MKRITSLLLLATLFYPWMAIAQSGSSAPLSPIQERIKKYCDQLEDSRIVKLEKRKVIGNQVIIGFYESLDYKPLWEKTKNRADLVDILEDSYFEGLDPEDYHFEFIKSYNEEVKSGMEIDPDEKAKADIIMTDALLTYSLHMIQGKVNPAELDPNWNYSENKIPDNVEIKILHRLQAESLKEGIDNIRSQMRMYHQLKYWFARYDSIQKVDGEIKMIQYPGSPLRLGDSSPIVGEIKRSLSNYSNELSYDDDDHFDETLESAIKEFQAENGLKDDGIAGKGTFSAMNIPISERLDIIRINMERCRWVNNHIPQNFILVNIADYNLYLYEDLEIVYRCRVVVGKQHHETPVFNSDIKYVVFNPTWTVPYSISSKEILPKLKKDPSYLQDRNMTLLKGGNEVDPASVDFNKYSKNNFPFTIRQEPGPNNALGMVKFIFPNKHAVYLHDTPSKSYFGKTDRAYSHGCVRVHNPMILAELLLADKGYDQEKIASTLKTKELKNVYLTEPLPVMLMYLTSYQEDGKIYFYKDVYGRDKMILKELREER
jgi:murein L,D-transpeptidase YcbB/YkuD